MDASTLLTITSSLVAALFGILSVVIGWVGSRIVTKQDETSAKLDNVKDEMHSLISNMGMRIVKVETKLGIYK